MFYLGDAFHLQVVRLLCVCVGGGGTMACLCVLRIKGHLTFVYSIVFMDM